MVTARGWQTASVLATGNVLIAGGVAAGPGAPVLSSAELYDPTAGTFVATGGMAVARWGHTASVLGSGKVLVVGGARSATGTPYLPSASAELYDPMIGTFAPTSSMAVARWEHTASVLSSGKVLVASGDDGSGVVYPSSAELFALLAADGSACAGTADCLSGVCNERCCTTTCSGVCTTCDIAGACVAVTSADDPDTCTGAMTCDTNGACVSNPTFDAGSDAAPVPALDAGMDASAMDAGRDASAMDASSSVDAAAISDAAIVDDSATGDASSDQPAPEESGCGCRVVLSPPTRGAGGASFIIGSIMALRRRRRWFARSLTVPRAPSSR